jgi:hypothetical protein
MREIAYYEPIKQKQKHNFNLKMKDIGQAAGSKATPTKSIARLQNANHYVEKLVRLIPSEAVLLYLSFQGIIGSKRPITLIAWSTFCLILTGLIRYSGTKGRGAKSHPQWGAVIIATISFVIWLYNIGGPFLFIPNFHDPVIASLIVAGWTTITTHFYETRST